MLNLRHKFQMPEEVMFFFGFFKSRLKFLEHVPFYSHVLITIDLNFTKLAKMVRLMILMHLNLIDKSVTTGHIITKHALMLRLMIRMTGLNAESGP